MNQKGLTVFEWPNDASKLRVENDLLVIALRTPLTTQRTDVRQHIRTAIQEVLALLLNCPASEIKLLSQAGQAIKLANADHNIGLSISHEPELSLAAINMHGHVGIDLIAIGSIPEPEELRIITTEYLGVKVAEYISKQPVEAQKKVFAKVWTAFEASLKLKGEALVEWSAARDAQLKNISSIRLNLAEGYIGALAYEKQS
jgi:4'-phosphopantetheinyl transferase